MAEAYLREGFPDRALLALEALDGTDPASIARQEGVRAAALTQLERLADAKAALDAAVQAAEASGDQSLLARTLFNRGHITGSSLASRPSELAERLMGGARASGVVRSPSSDDVRLAARLAVADYREAATAAEAAGDDALAAEASLFAAKGLRVAELHRRAADALGDALAAAERTSGAARAGLQVAIAEEAVRVLAATPEEIPDPSAYVTALAEALAHFEATGAEAERAYALGVMARHRLIAGDADAAVFATRAAIRFADRANDNTQVFMWQAQLGALALSRGDQKEALAAFRRSRIALELARPGLASRPVFTGRMFFYDEVRPYTLAFVDALTRPEDGAQPSQSALREAVAGIDLLRNLELEQFLGDVCLNEGDARPADVVDTQAAILYPIVRADRTDLIVVAGGRYTFASTPIAGTDLQARAEQLRDALLTPVGDSYRAAAGDLYAALIAPVEPAITAAGATRLVVSADGPLRFVPAGALWDGERHLIERYAVSVTPSLRLVDPKPFSQALRRPVYFGVSESVEGFSPLPGVRDELAQVSDEMAGPVRLDADFTGQALADMMTKTPASILHIATHGSFQGGAEDSFILTGEGRLSLLKLGELVRRSGARAAPLELLVLSACETAVGDDRALLGLAGAAYRAGARAVLGSMWQVNDASTARMQRVFYTELAAGASKADALQAAQRVLIADPEYSHPYYWSAFVLVGNWL